MQGTGKNKTGIYWVIFFLCLAALSCTKADSHGRPAHTPEKFAMKYPAVSKRNYVDTVLYKEKFNSLFRGDTSVHWTKTPYPLQGALLPFHRIVAYYGNLYSKGMGILGEYPKDTVLAKLQEEVKNWQKADSLTPVIPALHYIAVTAQSQPGATGKYVLRMPFAQIDTILAMAKKINAIVFLDIQPGQSTVQTEIPLLGKYLQLPDVHLAIDPEYSMTENIPCTIIGTMDAADINYAADYLAALVKKYNLPPKILVIHRFTQGMVTNASQIKTCPEVQVVMDMDGFGFKAKKINSYERCEVAEPVQFTGFKLFYKVDTKHPAGSKMMTPEEVLQLTPQPVYIQYQ